MARSLNSEPKASDNIAGIIDGKRLADYRDSIAALMEEQKAISDDIKDIAAQCDQAGIATKREIRRLAKESLMDQDVLHDQLKRMDLLRHVLGEFAYTPLGEATIARGAQAEKEPATRGRKPKAKIAPISEAMDKAREHLGGDPEQRMDDDLGRIIGEPAGAA